MDPQLPTDADTNRFFSHVIDRLESSGVYSQQEACDLVREYYQKFRDPQYCQSIKIATQDDDFFFHEGVGGMARRIHYYLTLKGDPNPQSFVKWRNSIGK
ncbi:MAG: hypothetical protein ABG776_15015 [Cyanobacteria bacterium J06555_13]